MTDRTCSIDGCQRKSQARGWCQSHDRRERLYGDPLGSEPISSVVDRVLSGATTGELGCWIPSRAPHDTGYTSITVDGVRYYAHRVMYEAFIADIPSGYQIDHLCRNRRCCNPWHLEAVPPRVNILRGTSPSAGYVTRTHCANGHAWDEVSTYIRPDTGARQCRTCNIERAKAARQAVSNA